MLVRGYVQGLIHSLRLASGVELYTHESANGSNSSVGGNELALLR